MANGGIIGPVNNPTSTTATGVWQQEEQYEARVTDTWPQRALFTTKSARFNDDSSDYLNRTPSSATNQKTFTISMWVKRSELGAGNGLILQGVNSGNDDFSIYFNGSTDNLAIFSWASSSEQFTLATNRKFRDVSAWYHIVVAVDTTQGTAANRVKLYINGVQETSFATENYPSQNINLEYNDTSALWVGRGYGGTTLDGYMTEVISVDGTALTPTSFGVTNSDGVWTPIPYSGTFGTNGFKLQFENAAALGTDSSPNGNTFTVNNLTSIDQSTDYPVVNFATANSLVVIGNTGQTYADGNLTFNASGNNWTATNSTIGASQGKWYAEFKVVTLASSTGYGMVGITGTENITNGNFISTEANSVGLGLDYRGSGQTYLYSAGSSVQAAGVAFAAGAIIGLAVDMDNKKFYFSQNGTYLTVGGSVGDPTSGSTGTGALTIPAGIETFLFAVGGYSTSFKGTWNFGSPAYSISSSNADGNGYGNFEYAVPSGYYALNTANLAEFG